MGSLDKQMQNEKELIGLLALGWGLFEFCGWYNLTLISLSRAFSFGERTW